PASVWRRTVSATAVFMRAAKDVSSTLSPSAFFRINAPRSSGRGRLPTCVVRMRSVLRFISSSPTHRHCEVPGGAEAISTQSDTRLLRCGRNNNKVPMAYTMTAASSDGDTETARELFRAYAASLPFSLDFQGFDTELGGLPQPYVPPGGCLLIARQEHVGLAVVGLKPLAPGIAEIKRLFVVPEARGTGLGRALAERAIAEAKAKGYERVRLD